MSWSKTPAGFAATMYGRKCEIVRRGGNTGSSYRASVEGIDSDSLRNKGYARDFGEGKQIVFDALTAAGLVPKPPGGASRYAPHPIEVRARCLDAAVNFVGSLGLVPPSGDQDVARRVAQVKSVALALERFVLSAESEAVDGQQAA